MKNVRVDKFGPDGEPKTESAMPEMVAKRTTAGEIHFDNKQPFILSREPYRVPKPRGRKTPDVLVIKLDETWSEMRTEALGRKVWYFQVYNETRGSQYSTELFEGINGEPCGNCNCPAAVVCKHIINCCLEVLTKHDPQFGEREKNSEFMVGLRIAPPGVTDF